MSTKDLDYFEPDIVRRPIWPKVFASRFAFPLLCLLSREQSLRLGLIPIDDERVIQAIKDGMTVIVNMITTRMAKFIQWLSYRNDPDHQERCIDQDHELMGMSPSNVKKIMTVEGFKNVKRCRFVFGLNSIYTDTI